jgi:hypothetical protein
MRNFASHYVVIQPKVSRRGSFYAQEMTHSVFLKSEIETVRGKFRQLKHDE